MEVEAAVVEIDRADCCDPVIGDKDLGMDEAGGIFVDPNPLLGQRFIEGPGHAEDHFFVRDAGGDDPDVDTASGSEPQGIYELVVQDEVGGHDIAVVLCLIQDIHIDILADMVLIQRHVGVGDDIAVPGFRIFSGSLFALGRCGGGRILGRQPELREVLFLIREGLPVGEKHDRI